MQGMFDLWVPFEILDFGVLSNLDGKFLQPFFTDKNYMFG